MGVGFQDSAPAVNPPLREVSPPMAAEASSGIDRRFTLDHSSFEKLLAAAWVLQCLQDQLHGSPVDRDDEIAERAQFQKELEIPSPVSQAIMEPAIQFPLGTTDDRSENVPLTDRPAPNDTVAESAGIPQPFETGTLNFDAPVNIKPEPTEFKEKPPAEDIATAHAVKALAPVLATSAKHHDKQSARRRAAFNLQTAFNRAGNAFNRLLPPFPTFRVNLTLRGLRAVAVATPVWLLSLVAALLFLGVWRQQPLHSAQAVARSTPPAEAVVDNSSTSVPTTTHAAPAVTEEVKKHEDKPRWSSPVPPLEGSHERITDPATLSAVEQLSRYEIKGLRRQAKYGDESAAFTLGMAYEVGHSVHQNCVEAARWVATAAEAGDVAAQYNLGLRYRDGDGVPANRAESEKWLRKAAAGRNRQAKQALKMLASR